MKRKSKTPARKHSEFLRLAFAALVLRGYGREKDIPDPILRQVWRLGKAVHTKPLKGIEVNT